MLTGPNAVTLELDAVNADISHPALSFEGDTAGVSEHDDAGGIGGATADYASASVPEHGDGSPCASSHWDPNDVVRNLFRPGPSGCVGCNVDLALIEGDADCHLVRDVEYLQGRRVSEPHEAVLRYSLPPKD